MTIGEDASVKMKIKLVGAELIRSEIESFKDTAVKKNSDVQVTPVAEGNMTGYEMSASYKSIEEFAKSQNAGSMFSNLKGTNRGIKKHDGWFFDTYSFDFSLQSDNKNKPADKEEQMMVQALMAQVKFDYVMNLPYAAENSNADQTTNENKRLLWNLAPVLTSNTDKDVQATFKIWHKERAALTAALGLLMLIGVIFSAAKIMTAGDNQEAKNKFIAAATVLVSLLLLSCALSAYSLFSSVTFTDKDIISVSSDADNNNNNNNNSATAPAQTTKPAVDTDKQAKKKIETPAPKQNTAENSSFSEIQKVLNSNGINGKVLATSFGHSDSGSLSLISNSKGKSLLLIDKINNQVALVEYKPEVYNFIDNRGKSYIPPVIFDMTILNDKRDNDQSLGIWNGNDHSFGVYAVYEFDNNGNVKPGMLTSGAGLHPSHYQAYLNERKNVDISNLFLTEMFALHRDADNRGVN